MTAGSGENLLLQWFLYRDRMPHPLRDFVRSFTKKSLLDIAMDWVKGKNRLGREGPLALPQTTALS